MENIDIIQNNISKKRGWWWKGFKCFKSIWGLCLVGYGSQSLALANIGVDHSVVK